MDHPKTYLLKQIVGYETNGFASLGHLHARHIDDLSKVMMQFTEATIKEVIEGLNNGDTIDINGKYLSLKRTSKPKKLKP